jgi:tripartite-type tricarboxylate transporter receptor subunit TctC
VGRIVGQRLAEQVGQPVVPDNRPGAGGNLGVELAAKARPDGYTIVIVTGGITISPSIYTKLNYDPVADFAPIAMLGRMQNLLLVSPSLPVKSVSELVEFAKANPGKLRYGSSGIGTPGHLASELFKSLAKINVVHVPYKGLNDSMVGVINGEVHMMVSNVSTAMPQLQSGKIKALAVLSNERVSSLPDVPTGREAGIENWEVIVWWGFLAPAGTPRVIVDRLAAEIMKAAAMPDTKEKLQKAGVEPVSGTPEQLAEFIRTEIARWAKVIKEADIKRLD